MYRAIYRLGKVDKALILLFLEDKKYEEIAQILGMTTSNIGVRLLRARKKLEAIINGSTEDI
jgi:RNA polymerase sigma-70 factor (ECF subfamily)